VSENLFPAARFVFRKQRLEKRIPGTDATTPRSANRTTVVEDDVAPRPVIDEMLYDGVGVGVVEITPPEEEP
jgi:hypothetical protein